MNTFYAGCDLCKHRLSPQPRRCFECGQLQPFAYKETHCLGKYYSRRRPEHYQSQWSKGILKLKQGSSAVMCSISQMLAHYMQTALEHLKPYVLTNVPMWTAGEKQLFAPDMDFGITRRLALSTLQNLQNSKRIECHQLLKLTGNKTKPQRQCKTYSERQANIQEAFAAQALHIINQANIVVIDDVLTTGSTLQACSDVLKCAGARSVTAVVLGLTDKKRKEDIHDVNMYQMQGSVSQPDLFTQGVS